MAYFFFDNNESNFIELLNNCLELDYVKNDEYLFFLIKIVVRLLEQGESYPDTMNWIKEKQIIQFIENNLNESRESIFKFRSYLRDIRQRMLIENETRRSSGFNSEDFYKTKIEELQKREIDLNNELAAQKEKNDQFKAKEKELEDTKEKIKLIEQEHEGLKKKLNASDTLKKSINSTFDELKKHTKPLEIEKKRLNWLFGCYAFLSLFVLVVLVVFECKYLSKWETTPKTWIDYLPFYIPVPIIGALLWAFIFQMNRAQRQLVLLANKLYHIDYIEELLLSITNVSPNVNVAAEKISQVIDQMIKIYIKIPNNLSEESLDKAISKDSIKDSINLQNFLDLAKEVKDVIK